MALAATAAYRTESYSRGRGRGVAGKRACLRPCLVAGRTGSADPHSYCRKGSLPLWGQREREILLPAPGSAADPSFVAAGIAFQPLHSSFLLHSSSYYSHASRHNSFPGPGSY